VDLQAAANSPGSPHGRRNRTPLVGKFSHL
jgi:hypothetical protein